MKLTLPHYFKYIGLILILISFIYELNRTPLNFSKGYSSFVLPLFFILISKNKNKSVNKGSTFLFSFLLTWFLARFLSHFLHFKLDIHLFAVIVLSISIIIVYIQLLWAKISINV